MTGYLRKIGLLLPFLIDQVLGGTVNEETKEKSFKIESNPDYHIKLHINCNPHDISVVARAIEELLKQSSKYDISDLQLEDCIINKPLVQIFDNKLKSLKHLKLRGNKDKKPMNMTSEEINTAIQNLTQIEELSLTYLGLQSLNLSKSKLENLKQLDLSGNNLTEFPSVGGSIYIEKLNISYNNLSNVQCTPSNAPLFKNLTELDISGNKHLTVDLSDYQCFGRLTVLRMVELDLKEVDVKLWGFHRHNQSNVPLMSLLDLSNNKFEKIDEKVLESLKQTVQSVKMGGNPWICDCDLSSFIKFVNGKETKIADVDDVRCNGTESRVDHEKICPEYFLVGWLIGLTIIGMLVMVIGVLFYKHRKNNH